MTIIGIETSCDETAASVVENGTKILSNVVASSKEIQKKYGGIIPEQASREQVKTILPVIQEALKLASSNNGIKGISEGLSVKRYRRNAIYSLDAIAVTIGPGLIGSLLVGVETAKTLAYAFKKPIIPVNHLLAHIYAAWFRSEIPNFPAVCLIISGGHTLLVLMKGHTRFKLLGQTRDDAAGEAFDKTARLINLPYPGGPAIEKAAKNGNYKAFSFPRPMINSDDYDFSFSGLKTSVLRKIKKLNLKPKTFNSPLTSDLAASIQEAIVDVLLEKTIRAAKEYKVKSIIVGGGVAANKRLAKKFSALNSQFSIFIPPPELCTDNATVIAATAYFYNKPIPWKEITALPDLQFPSNHENMKR